MPQIIAWILIPKENGSAPELLYRLIGSKNNPKQFLTPIITQTIIEHVININFQFISFCFILITASIWAKV